MREQTHVFSKSRAMDLNQHAQSAQGRPNVPKEEDRSLRDKNSRGRTKCVVTGLSKMQMMVRSHLARG